MREGIVKKWTEALRSGKFTQTDGKLYNPNNEGYCCLGVLLEVASPFDWDADSRMWVSDDEEIIHQYNEWFYEMNHEDAAMPNQKVYLEDEELPS